MFATACEALGVRPPGDTDGPELLADAPWPG
jgi:hypothetical protein